MLKSKSGKRRLFVAGAILVMGASIFTACTSKLAKASVNFDKSAIYALNNSSVVQEVIDTEFNDFAFLGADFTRVDEDNLDVDISGVAKYNQGQNKAIVKMSYTLNDDIFDGVDELKKHEVVEALGNAIQSEEMREFDLMQVSNIKALNDTLKEISESPIDGYDFKNGMVVSLGNLQFNEDDNTISFQMKNHNDYVHTTTVMQPMIIPNGNGGSTTVMRPVTTYSYEDFLHTNDIYIKVSDKEMEEMKADPSKIIDTFINYVKNGEKGKYVVNSVEIDKLSGQDTSMIDDLDYERM